MWAEAYSVSPSGIFVPPNSALQRPDDLADVPITVGYHSGSHYSTLQGLERFLRRDQIKLHFGGLLLDRLALLVDGQVPAASLFGVPFYVAEQLGFKGKANYGPERVGDIKHSLADITRAKAELGYKPKVQFHEGLRRTVQWYLAEQEKTAAARA